MTDTEFLDLYSSNEIAMWPCNDGTEYHDASTACGEGAE